MNEMIQTLQSLLIGHYVLQFVTGLLTTSAFQLIIVAVIIYLTIELIKTTK